MNADPVELAACARAFEARLATLACDLAPEGRQQASPLWGCIAALPDEHQRLRATARLFARDIGALPALERLLDRHARLVLLDRQRLLRQLCILALARRPGVMRSCVARAARIRLEQALGEAAFATLMASGALGRPAGEAVAQWTPERWSCVGYFDWTSLLRSSDSALRRTVRFSLPQKLTETRKLLRQAPPDLSPGDALQLLETHGVEWSC